MNIGTVVIIPRTGGSESPGEIIELYTDRARVRFPIGETYRGRPTPDGMQELYGYKTLPLDQLRVVAR